MITFKEQFEKTKGKYYLYALIRPDKNGEYFYIGKGKKKRIFDHFRKNQAKANPHKWHIIQKVLDQGYVQEDTLKILMITDDEQYANDMEKALIKRIGRSDKGLGPLTNGTDGGEGASGKVFTEEYRKKLSKGMKGKCPWNKGLKGSSTGSWNGSHHTEEAKKQISIGKSKYPLIATNVQTGEIKYFRSINEARNNNFSGAEAIVYGKAKSNITKGYSFRYATPEDIEKYSK